MLSSRDSVFFDSPLSNTGIQQVRSFFCLPEVSDGAAVDGCSSADRLAFVGLRPHTCACRVSALLPPVRSQRGDGGYRFLLRSLSPSLVAAVSASYVMFLDQRSAALTLVLRGPANQPVHARIARCFSGWCVADSHPCPPLSTCLPLPACFSRSALVRPKNSFGSCKKRPIAFRDQR